jgi:hypothetical protein
MNPYAELSREELDAELRNIDESLALPSAVPEREELEARRKKIVQGYLWLMVRDGKAAWSGGKPEGSNPLIELTPGPPIWQLVSEGRL